MVSVYCCELSGDSRNDYFSYSVGHTGETKVDKRVSLLLAFLLEQCSGRTQVQDCALILSDAEKIILSLNFFNCKMGNNKI